MTRRRISPTLSAEGGRLRCSRCDHALADDGQPWKQAAALNELAVSAMPGAASVARELVLRRFSCPACGSLLDTETAMPGDPFLDDVLEPARDRR